MRSGVDRAILHFVLQFSCLRLEYECGCPIFGLLLFPPALELTAAWSRVNTFKSAKVEDCLRVCNTSARPSHHVRLGFAFV